MASVTLSFDAWKGLQVAPTKHTLVVLPATPGPKVEAVSNYLVGRLVHPERTATVGQVQFSPDGKQLFTSGYPSGIVQIWDVASRKESRRINSPAGYRGSFKYALLTSDWKTLYIPVDTRKVVKGEKDGKPFTRLERSGEIRVWDLATGEEKAPLKSSPNAGPIDAVLSPDDSTLVVVERVSFQVGDEEDKAVTLLWNLKTGDRRKLVDDSCSPVYSKNGKTLAVQYYDTQNKKSQVKLFDASSLKEIAQLTCPEKDRFFSLGAFSPDGSLLTVILGGKEGVPPEVWVRDGKTLADRGKVVGKGDPKQVGWRNVGFTPDNSSYILVGKESAEVFDLATRKINRSIETGPNTRLTAISPDSKFLAIAWVPKYDEDLGRNLNADPTDFPQPRITLVNLTTNAQPQVLVCPHGFLGQLAFSPDSKTLAVGSSGGVLLFEVGK